MLQIPVNGFFYALFKGKLRPPAELLINFPGINGIAAIMAKPVLNKGDQLAPGFVVQQSNALINQASIVDGGVNSTTYTGGSVYSDELLIQAELISDDTNLYTQGADALVSEAVAFLSDDLMASPEGDADQNAPDPSTPDGGTADVMQTMLG